MICSFLRYQDLGYESFSHLFYFEKQPSDEEDSIEFLMSAELDRDAYFVIKANRKEDYLERYPELEIILEKDGYVFTVIRAGPKDP